MAEAVEERLTPVDRERERDRLEGSSFVGVGAASDFFTDGDDVPFPWALAAAEISRSLETACGPLTSITTFSATGGREAHGETPSAAEEEAKGDVFKVGLGDTLVEEGDAEGLEGVRTGALATATKGWTACLRHSAKCTSTCPECIIGNG